MNSLSHLHFIYAALIGIQGTNPPPTSSLTNDDVITRLSYIMAITGAISIPIAVFAAIVTYLGYRKQKEKKEITWERVSEANVVTSFIAKGKKGIKTER